MAGHERSWATKLPSLIYRASTYDKNPTEVLIVCLFILQILTRHLKFDRARCQRQVKSNPGWHTYLVTSSSDML